MELSRRVPRMRKVSWLRQRIRVTFIQCGATRGTRYKYEWAECCGYDSRDQVLPHSKKIEESRPNLTIFIMIYLKFSWIMVSSLTSFLAVTQVTKNTLIYFFFFFLSICDAFSPHPLKLWKNFHILYFHTKVLCRYVHKSINLIYILPLTSLIYVHVKSFDLITYYQTDLNKYDAILFLKTET